MRRWSIKWIKTQVKRDFDLNISDHTAREIQSAHREGTLLWVVPPDSYFDDVEEARNAKITFPNSTGGQTQIWYAGVRHNGAMYSHDEWEYEEALTQWPKLRVLPFVTTGHGERVVTPVENALFRYAEVYPNPVAGSPYRYIGRVYDKRIPIHSPHTIENVTVEKREFRTLYEAGEWLHTKQHDTRMWRGRK